MADSNDELVSKFVDITGAPADEATDYLSAVDWNVENALAAFFAAQEDTHATESGNGAATASSSAAPEPEYTGPRTLDGRPAPQYAGASSSASKSSGKKPQKRTGLATLSSIGGSHHHDDDDDEDDDDFDEDDKRGPRDLFAGGEKSGLAVQDPSQKGMNPRKLVEDIVAKARSNARTHPSGDPPAPASPSTFRGAGQTLGGDGVESRTIPDPNAPSSSRAGAGSSRSSQEQDGPVQERILHLWSDGFSIDDGELHRFDDPRNRHDLEMIRAGRAPLHLMNVRLDQRVDVKLQQHEDNWKPLPKVYRPFGGEGRRLGSPVPGEAAPSVAISTPSTAASAVTTGTTVDESQPTLMLRIQLPNGTRMPARFNVTHTIGDVYEFVSRAWTSLNDGRPWVIATTFPNKDHTDRALVLGEVPEFKKGGTAVVKWS